MAAAKMGLNTSVVLRLLVGEPVEQARSALQAVNMAAAEDRAIIVSDLVVSEAYFALHAHYNVPKRVAMQTLLDFLNSGAVTAEGVSVEALDAAIKSSRKLGFIDRLIHAQYRKSSASLVTFEKAASRLEDVVLLKTRAR